MADKRIQFTVMLAALLVVGAAAGCGSDEDSSSSTVTVPIASSAESLSATPQIQDLSASLTWPDGTDAFTFNACASQGEHTILGRGDSTDGSLNLVLDANLLNAGDTGTLTVSQKSDMAVVYDADVTDLTVRADGTFSGSGQDAGQQAFTITGTCDVSW